MITLKRLTWHIEVEGEHVQLIQRCVTHQMAPHPTAPRPSALIYEDSHRADRYLGTLANASSAAPTAPERGPNCAARNFGSGRMDDMSPSNS